MAAAMAAAFASVSSAAPRRPAAGAGVCAQAEGGRALRPAAAAKPSCPRRGWRRRHRRHPGTVPQGLTLAALADDGGRCVRPRSSGDCFGNHFAAADAAGVVAGAAGAVADAHEVFCPLPSMRRVGRNPSFGTECSHSSARWRRRSKSGQTRTGAGKSRSHLCPRLGCPFSSELTVVLDGDVGASQLGALPGCGCRGAAPERRPLSARFVVEARRRRGGGRTRRHLWSTELRNGRVEANPTQVEAAPELVERAGTAGFAQSPGEQILRRNRVGTMADMTSSRFVQACPYCRSRTCSG